MKPTGTETAKRIEYTKSTQSVSVGKLRLVVSNWKQWSLSAIHGLRDIRASCPSVRTTDRRIFNPQSKVSGLY